MKKKYLAIMMGLTLAAAPTSAFAQEAELSEAETQEILVSIEETEDKEQENVDKSTENQQYWGKVIAIDENEVTIAVGTIAAQENAAEIAADETETQENAAEMTNGETETQENAAEITNGETEAQENIYELFEVTSEEITIPITEATEIYFVYGNADIAYLELEFGDAESLSIEKTEQAAEEEVNVEGTEASEEINVAGTEVTEKAADAAGTEVTEEAADAAGTEVTEDTAAVTETEAANEELYATEDTMIKIENAELADILTDDLVKITLDENGNAGIILIAMNQSESEAEA